MKIIVASLPIVCIVISVLVAYVSGDSELCKAAKPGIEGKRKNFGYAALAPKNSAKQEAAAAARTAQTTGDGSKTEFQRDSPLTLQCDKELNDAADKAAAKLAKEDEFDQFKAPLQKKYGENIAVFLNVGHDKNSKIDSYTVTYDDKEDQDNAVLITLKKPEDAVKQAIEIWYKEGHCYKFSNPTVTVYQFVEHFIAMIWKDTAYIGVGVGTSSSGNVYVVAYFLTVSRIPPYVGTEESFAENIPYPLKPSDFNFQRYCRGETNLSIEDYSRKPVTAEEVMAISKDAMRTLVDADLVKKERNKIARLAMLMCEQSDPEIRKKVREWMPESEDRDKAKSVSFRIGQTLCSDQETNTMYQAFACQYLKCVQQKSVENNIDYHLNSKTVRGIDEYQYGRKVAQHRCQRDFKSWANVGLALNVMSAYPLLKAAQEKVEQKELDKCVNQKQFKTTGSMVVKDGKAKLKLTTVAVE